MKFKRIMCSGIIFLLYISPVIADVFWEQQSTISDDGYTVTSRQKIYFTAEKFAFDSDDGMRVIVDIIANTITTIDETKKMYYISNVDEMAQKMDELKAQSEEILTEALKNIPENMREEYEKTLRNQLNNIEDDTMKPNAENYKPTGKISQIAGYSAYQYFASGENGTSYMMWCTKDVDIPELQTFYKNLGEISFFKDVSPDPDMIKLGFPVKSIEKTNNTTIMTEVISISMESVKNNCVFSIPEGFTQSDEIFLSDAEQ
ncbi:MAG: DUF4412 domain-containing protein [Candidatus Latescibacteria bacterium]|nr:DUF4412 domain-containing protein [Candidatus Latescibacterota bacterium]